MSTMNDDTGEPDDNEFMDKGLQSVIAEFNKLDLAQQRRFVGWASLEVEDASLVIDDTTS